jgi:hypothetical protein
MDTYTKVSGSMDSNTVQVCGEELEVILILANGNLEKQMAMEFILGSMVIDTKDSLRHV